MIHNEAEATDTKFCALGFYLPKANQKIEKCWKLRPVKGFEMTLWCDRNPLKGLSTENLELYESRSWVFTPSDPPCLFTKNFFQVTDHHFFSENASNRDNSLLAFR